MNTKVNGFVHDGGIRIVGTERRREGETERRGKGGRKWKRQLRKEGEKERRRKGKQWKGNSFPLAEETCETRSLIAFKNREFAPATRKLSENLDSFHWNAFLYPGHRRDSNFSSPPRSHSSRMHRGNCATWPSLHDPLHVLFSMYICWLRRSDPRACK